jgi:hypothetical protein
VSPVFEYTLAAALPTAIGLGLVLLGRLLQLDQTENASYRLPGKYLRCRAVRAAYLDALRTACLAVDVAPPVPEDPDRVPQTEIYRVEAALRLRGMDVRPTAPH